MRDQRTTAHAVAAPVSSPPCRHEKKKQKVEAVMPQRKKTDEEKASCAPNVLLVNAQRHGSKRIQQHCVYLNPDQEYIWQPG